MLYEEEFPEIELTFKRSGVVRTKINTPDKAYEVGMKLFNPDTIDLYESFAVLFLNNSSKTTGFYQASQGGITGALVDVRLVFATALKHGATAMILYHNHPSGILEPSRADIILTEKIEEACKLLDIKLHDHLILASEGHYSFRNEGIL